MSTEHIEGAVPSGKAPADRAAMEALKNEYARFSGTWKLVKGVVDGGALPEAEVRNTTITIEGNTFRYPNASGVGSYTAGSFTLNPGTNPPQADSTSEKGGLPSPGIYEFTDATHYRACFGPQGGPRPNGFESSPGSGRRLQHWEKLVPTSRGAM